MVTELFVTWTFFQKNNLSQCISSHGHFVADISPHGHVVRDILSLDILYRTFCHMGILPQEISVTGNIVNNIYHLDIL